ncbi:anthranilate phosphoribosyltransferase [Propioniciclava flava]|uniref:Anthranilate phosphoribosyltransferase n=1 Tax=Propioniciclava flava TaxID=2072026 RepID=A0A4Q2EIA4_9ACTN|nr:anthranilate phosphoribosyltransferase [Propioniciclava flava]RXW32332.1 anthranilate phosphoribosyltransferase [Propioniciclava flava]
MSRSWPDVLTGLVTGNDLDPEAAAWAMNEILVGAATPAQIAGFMVALQAKGVTPGELTGLVSGMLANARSITLPTAEAVDIVGTGGDRANTVNISTMAAVTAAAAGARVVKHGNRAASSASGTADCLEALGVVLDLDPASQAQVFEDVGIVFLFASHYHPSLRNAAAPRRELGIRTVFNFLGPLANPARPNAQAIGVADPVMAGVVADVVAGRGQRGLVFHGGDGLDELTTTTQSRVWVVADGRVVETTLDPADLGIPRATRDDLIGGDPAVNAQVARDTFAGKPGAVRDIVTVNAAAALLAFDGPDLDAPLADQFRDRIARASQALDDGSATALLQRWVDATRRLAR